MSTHDPDGGHSRIYDAMAGLGAELGQAEARIRHLEQLVETYGETLDGLRNRVYALERDTPQARRLQYEADQAAADLAGSGYRGGEW